MMKRFGSTMLACLIGGSALVAGCATTGPGEAAPDRIELGLDATGDPCSARRNWRDPAAAGEFDQSWVVTCRTVTASRAVGFVRSIVDRPGALDAVEASLACGEARPVEVAGVGTVEARRCFDSAVNAPAVAFAVRRGDRWIVASGVPAVVGPLENAVRQLAGAAAAPSGERPAIALESLPPAPASAAGSTAGSSDFNAGVALQQGIALNHSGLYLEASRLLNDALSRLPSDASPALRVQLLLETALADSNIRFDEAAAANFARADEILASTPTADQAFLQRKRDIYVALDLLNRRQFQPALAILERLGGARTQNADPLRDPLVVQALNQAGAGQDVSRTVAAIDAATLSQLLLEAQAQWARSVALLALNDVAGASAGLEAAERRFAIIRGSRANPAATMWMQARLDRQRGRIAARQGDWAAAQLSYDEAVRALSLGAVGGPGSGTAPAIAEMQLERASIALQRGASPAEVIREYEAAVDALVASGAAGAPVAGGVERYLRFLVDNMEGPDRQANQERFFRAIQAAGNPGAARQLTQLQNVLSADPERGARLRDRADLTRELVALRYEITARDASDPAAAAELAALEQRRRQVQNRLLEVETELAGDARLSTVEEQPVTLAEIRSALQPGEAYFKLFDMGGRAYGVLIDERASHVYPIAVGSAELDRLARDVRLSIDGSIDAGRLVEFDVGSAYTLFRLLTGPATDEMLRARALIVDPAGPLQSLPLGVLVVDRASVDSYRASRRRREFDFSNVAFLANRAPISTAVSPRSFLVARQLPPSAAAQPFIAFAEPASPAATGAPARVEIGPGCSLGSQDLARLWGQLGPIDVREAHIAAEALGAGSAPVVSGAQFTDSDMLSRDDLNQYKVLHFATHGFEEGAWGCDNSPPALLTSLADGDSNGLLSFAEIAGLRLDANLVVLSACDTGAGIRNQELARRSGQEESGATLEGLVRAFLTANSRAVMATHWQVSAEEESNEFMRVFYGTARSRPIGEALQAAQRQLIADPEFSHPFYWGAYFVVGDSGKMMLGGSRSADAAGEGGAASGAR